MSKKIQVNLSLLDLRISIVFGGSPEKELREVQELFGQATDNCLNLKKPD